MDGQQIKIARKNQDTYVYIDVSNICSACLKTLGFMVDFVKLLDYLKQRYPSLKEVRYYEGIAMGGEGEQCRAADEANSCVVRWRCAFG